MMKRWKFAPSAKDSLRSSFASGGLSRLRRSILALRARGVFLTDHVKPSLWQRLVAALSIILKVVFSDSNNIILTWIRRYQKKKKKKKKKSLFRKFQMIPILTFHFMHDDVCFIAPIDFCVELSLVDETFFEICSYFILRGGSTYGPNRHRPPLLTDKSCKFSLF